MRHDLDTVLTPPPPTRAREDALDAGEAVVGEEQGVCLPLLPALVRLAELHQDGCIYIALAAAPPAPVRAMLTGAGYTYVPASSEWVARHTDRSLAAARAICGRRLELPDSLVLTADQRAWADRLVERAGVPERGAELVGHIADLVRTDTVADEIVRSARSRVATWRRLAQDSEHRDTP